MKQFEIVVKNEPGALVKVCELLNGKGVNIKAVATEAVDKASLSTERTSDSGVIKLVTQDEETTREALSSASLAFRESELLQLDVVDRPGELLKIAKKLADAKINVDSIFILGHEGDTTAVALVVDDVDAATELVG